MSSTMTGARCAIHPDRTAEMTCARCGSFACFECVGATTDGTCVRCRLRTGGSKSGQLRALGILLLVNGIMMSLFGGMYVLLGPLMAMIPQPPDQPDAAPPEFIGGFMAGYGFIALVPGILHFIAGIQLLRAPRNRMFQLIAIGAGFIGALTCYCAPQSIGLAIWGLILLHDREVIAMFEQNERGT